MFSDEAPKTATVRHGVESQQRTVIRYAANRAVIENFVDKIDDPKALSEAIKKFSARGRNALPRCKITTSVA